MHKLRSLIYLLILLPAIVTINLPYEGSDALRIFGAPPFFLITLIIVILFSIKLKIPKFIINYKSPFFWFIIYINITTLLLNPSGVIYSLSWMINYLIYRYYSISNISFKLKKIDFLVIISLLIVIGSYRLITGLDTDGNPYALINRNATSTIIVFFFVYYKSLFEKFSFVDLLLIVLLVLNGSRSSLLAIVAYYFIFYFKDFKLKRMVYFTGFIFLCLYMLSFNNLAIKRFNAGTNFFKQLNSKEVDEVGDYERVLLIRGGLQIFQENIFFGVGEGIKKYQEEFNRIVIGYNRDSRAHNFFVSRLANFGIVGFSLFLFGYYFELKAKKNFFLISSSFAIVFFFNEYVLLPHIFLLTGLMPTKQ
jgi:hypothetical protein